MKSTILAGLLVLAAGAAGLMAQPTKNEKAPEAAGAPAGPHPKSPDEQKALVAMIQAQGKPDDMIAAAENLITKFADTDYKDVALLFEAQAYQAKNDAEKAQLYAERATDANPKNFQAAIMLASVVAQHTRENDLDKADKLAKVQKYASQAIETLNAATKPNPQISDQDWENAKKDLIAQAHEALGLGAFVDKKYDAAITEFKAAVDGAARPDPASKVRLASAYQNAKRYDESIAMAESVMNDATAPQQVKQFAQAIRAGSVVAKNKATGQSTAPAPPAQVEIKPQ